MFIHYTIEESAMKTMFRIALITVFVAGSIIPALAQFPSMQYFRTNDLNGMNVFETPKVEGSKYEGLKLRIGGIYSAVSGFKP